MLRQLIVNTRRSIRCDYVGGYDVVAEP